jgi:plasmid replication initiation protein
LFYRRKGEYSWGEIMPELTTWQKQPDGRAVVWQHNQLAEARYELTAREQKLLLYVVSMIEAEDDALKRYVVNIAEFAELANLDKDHLYQELRELAANLKRKALIIPNHYDSLTGRHVDLVTSWFDSAMIGRNGSGYFAVTISPQLRPYLLQVKREFFKFRLIHVMQMRSAYAIRLYQWLKRWEFRHVIEISVADLRVHMGAVGFDERGKRKENLALYPDFKRWAIKPAVNEINNHKNSDLRVSFEEIKAKGSRAVEKLRFRMVSAAKESADFTFPEPQPELPLGDVEQSQPDLIDELAARYGLNEKQRQKVTNYQAQKGIDYLRQKVVVVEQQPRKNSAAAFLAALRDDWKLAVEIKKQPRQKKEKIANAEQMSPEQGREAAKALREFRASLT